MNWTSLDCRLKTMVARSNIHTTERLLYCLIFLFYEMTTRKQIDIVFCHILVRFGMIDRGEYRSSFVLLLSLIFSIEILPFGLFFLWHIFIWLFPVLMEVTLFKAFCLFYCIMFYRWRYMYYSVPGIVRSHLYSTASYTSKEISVII